MDNQTIKSFLKEGAKKKGKKKASSKTVAKNIQSRFGSKSVQNTLSQERATADQQPTTLTPEMVEAIVEDSGVVIETGKDPVVSISFMNQAYGPVMTSLVTGEKNGHPLLRVLINEDHDYFDIAINNEDEKELWIEFLQAMALTDHTLQGVEVLDFEKIIQTLGTFLSSFRASDE